MNVFIHLPVEQLNIDEWKYLREYFPDQEGRYLQNDIMENDNSS